VTREAGEEVEGGEEIEGIDELLPFPDKTFEFPQGAPLLVLLTPFLPDGDDMGGGVPGDWPVAVAADAAGAIPCGDLPCTVAFFG